MKIVEFIHDQDHPDISNIDFWVAEQGYSTKKVRVYQENELPAYASYDLLLLHGGAPHLWDKASHPWLEREVAYVKQALELNKPVIGFCLGSQILAEALGSKVYLAQQKEIGWYWITTRQPSCNSRLLDGLEAGFETFLWHSDHYHLPLNCQTLAFTEAAEHQVFASLAYPAVSYQFHPEYTKEIIRQGCLSFYEENWKAVMGEGGQELFLQGLSSRPETYQLFAKLMANALAWFSEKFNLK